MIFDYVKREDYVDSQGHAWRSAVEYVMRLRPLADLVPLACWTEPKLSDLGDTQDAELYRYGVHGRNFTACFTVDLQRSYQAFNQGLFPPGCPCTAGQSS